MAKLLEAESAVRDYLTFLDDPTLLIDRDRIGELERRISGSSDPVKRLRLFGQLEELQHPLEAPYREAFVRHAKQWADSNGVPAPAFLRMGVPKKVLDAAGLKTAATGTRSDVRTPRTKRATDEAHRPVSANEVAEVMSRHDKFTLQTILSASGASPMTVRKALKTLIESGAVRRIGPDPDWNSAGRAPNLYEYVRK